MLLNLISMKLGTILWLIGIEHDVLGDDEICEEFESSAECFPLCNLKDQD